jgi:predicted AAA+ superfamily ATPase
MVYIKREIERELIKWLESREIIAIRGARQSGKTTLLMRTKEILNNNNVDDDRIHYISFEDDIIRLKFEENVKEFIELIHKRCREKIEIDIRLLF